ncbi:Pentatricopeptide repeat-containing protein [Artemisia annua]|uniref:Pentatricopeptide repeat-containing protein n=1 Tax=Artemisia annua TaxID=35608 RepID=A0A2U1Q807_ARTAN|nr:Pentatricopeptide repeat-containing protein [Artemisia annua]
MNSEFQRRQQGKKNHKRMKRTFTKSSSDNLSERKCMLAFVAESFRIPNFKRQDLGLSVHGVVMKYGYDNDPHMLSGLISSESDSYGGRVCEIGGDWLCTKTFDEMPVRDVVVWNAMIMGLMSRRYMVAVLSACARLGAAKCGDIKMAMAVFMGMEEKNVYTWSNAMGRLAMNGYGKKCVKLFSLMQQEALKPNEVKFTSLLKCCSVAGLAEEGFKLFRMIKEYGTEPQAEHLHLMQVFGLFGKQLGGWDDHILKEGILNEFPTRDAWCEYALRKVQKLKEEYFNELLNIHQNTIQSRIKLFGKQLGGWDDHILKKGILNEFPTRDAWREYALRKVQKLKEEYFNELLNIHQNTIQSRIKATTFEKVDNYEKVRMFLESMMMFMNISLVNELPRDDHTVYEKVATLILNQIFNQQGKTYIGSFVERFNVVTKALDKMVDEFTGMPPPALLKNILICYI